MRGYLFLPLLYLFPTATADTIVYQTMLGISHSVGGTPVTSTERITYQCTFRNLWTKERQPINYPEDDAMWRGPIMWTHTSQLQAWARNTTASPGVKQYVEGGSAITLVQEMQQDPDNFWTYTENPQFILPLGVGATDRSSFVNMYPIEAKADYPYMSSIVNMRPSPDWFTGFYNLSLTHQGEFWFDHFKLQTYAWDAGTHEGESYRDGDSSDDAPPSPPVGGIPGFPLGALSQGGENPKNDSSSQPDNPLGYVDRMEFPFTAPPGGELLAADMPYIPVVAEFECFLHVGPRDMNLPNCDWFANPCCNETDTESCNATLPYGIAPFISKEYQQVMEADISTNVGREEDDIADEGISFGPAACDDCEHPGHFCGIDGECHGFSCSNFYQFAHLNLTGNDGETELECTAYPEGEQENAFGLVYGCNPLFPFAVGDADTQVWEVFNQKCTASGRDGYSFECFEFARSTNFSALENEAQSAFPNCTDSDPKYYYMIAGSISNSWSEGLQGNPVVSAGSDPDGVTLWQANANNDSFNGTLAMHSMYAKVVLPTERTAWNATNTQPGEVSSGNQSRSDEEPSDDSEQASTSARSSNPSSTQSSPLSGDPTPTPTYLPTDEPTPVLAIFNPSAAPSTSPTTTNRPSPISTTTEPSLGPSLVSSGELVVRVETSFDIFNTEGLTAVDLASPGYKTVLLEAFSDFVFALLVSLESNRLERKLHELPVLSKALRRGLSVKFQPESADVYDVIDVECQVDSGVFIPYGAACQSVSARYDLAITANENKENVQKAYAEATKEAISEGKLQTSLENVAQDSPLASINISGPSLEVTRASTTDVSSKGWQRIDLGSYQILMGCVSFLFVA